MVSLKELFLTFSEKKKKNLFRQMASSPLSKIHVYASSFFLENIMVLSKFQTEWQGNLLNSSVTEKWSINSIKRPLCLFYVCKTLMHSKSNTRWLTIHVLEIRASKLRSINVNISQLLQAQFISLLHSVKKCGESKWMLMEKSSTSCVALVPC